jgi:hypothetical protein
MRRIQDLPLLSVNICYHIDGEDSIIKWEKEEKAEQANWSGDGF